METSIKVFTANKVSLTSVTSLCLADRPDYLPGRSESFPGLVEPVLRPRTQARPERERHAGKN